MYLRSLLALLAGAILPFAYAPFHWYSLAFFSPALLCYFWLDATYKRAFWLGLFFGIGYFSVGVSWVFISVHTYGNASLLLALFITALFIIVLALYIALQGACTRLLFGRCSRDIYCLCAFPTTWTIAEWLRSHLFTGFPWLLLGYTQIDTPLRGFAPVFGVYGITLIIVFMSGCLVTLLVSRKKVSKIISIFSIFICVLVGSIFSSLHWTKPIDTPIKTSLVQGNIPQSLKWDSQNLMNILKKYVALTSQHWSSPLIVWPEAAIPIFLQQAQSFIQPLNVTAQKYHVYLISGIPIAHDQTQQYYNGLILLGAGQGQYLKRRLVPFGEYIPLPFLFNRFMQDFNIPMSNFSAGNTDQPPLKIKNFTIAPFICYEIAFSHLVLHSAKEANILLLLVDDSWFGNSLAPYQHFQIAQMRALETQRDTLVSTNSGITGFINAEAKSFIAPIDEGVVLTHTVQPRQGLTPVMRWGSYPVGIIIVLLLLLATFTGYLRKK